MLNGFLKKPCPYLGSILPVTHCCSVLIRDLKMILLFWKILMQETKEQCCKVPHDSQQCLCSRVVIKTTMIDTFSYGQNLFFALHQHKASTIKWLVSLVMYPVTHKGQSVTEWDLLANYVRDSSNQYSPHPKLRFSNGSVHRYYITKKRKGRLLSFSRIFFTWSDCIISF